MVVWESLHESNDTNAEIAASASEIFFSDLNDKQQLIKVQQSFNALEINNDDNSIAIDIELDGLATRRRRIFAKSSFTINPEDGIFFNFIKVTNTDAANAISAAKIKANARALRPRKT